MEGCRGVGDRRVELNLAAGKRDKTGVGDGAAKFQAVAGRHLDLRGGLKKYTFNQTDISNQTDIGKPLSGNT